MKKALKGFLAVVIVIVVLAVVAVSLVFSFINPCKIMVYSDAKTSAAVEFSLSKLENDALNGGVTLIAHRGLSDVEYQNTKEAFALAAADPNVDGIETDVWVTRDGHFVCMHDADSAEGIDDVRNATLEEVLAAPLKKKGKDIEKFPNVYHAPTLEEYLDICKTGDKIAVIELKDKLMSNDEIQEIYNIVKAKGVKYNFGSFYFEKLKFVRSIDEEVELHLFTLMGLPRDMAKYGTTSSKKLDAVIEQKINISCWSTLLTKQMADKFHKAGLKVGVWTVNDKKMAAYVIKEYGVDYLTTDKSQTELFK